MNAKKALKRWLMIFSIVIVISFTGCSEKKDTQKSIVRMKIVGEPPSSAKPVATETIKGKKDEKKGVGEEKPKLISKEKDSSQKEGMPPKVAIPAKTDKKEMEAKRTEKIITASKPKEEEKQIEVPYIYNPKGRKDPFKPFIREVKVSIPEEMKGVPLTPLQKEDLSQFKVVAIVSSGNQRFAMVEDKTGKGYIIKVGTFIGKGGGKVVEILPDRVLVEEQFIDLYGERKISRVALNLKKATEAGGK
jgi:type IV pilus assembly protein PilP